MLKNRIKNTSWPFPGKIIVCYLLLFFTSQLQAQEVKDTVAIIEEYKEDTVVNEKKEYFLQRWEDSSQSLLQQRKLPDTLIKKMQADDKFWYANAIFEKKKDTENQKDAYMPLGQRTWFQTLIWIIIIGGFAAFLMIYLNSINVGLFRKRNVLVNGTEKEIITEDIFAINYQKEIDKAAMQGNYRHAIRLMYLRLLKNMSEKNIIHYKQDKTNLDYLLQLHPTVYYKDFFRLTRNYEYSWYGQFEVNEEAYKIIRTDFDQFDRSINH